MLPTPRLLISDSLRGRVSRPVIRELERRARAAARLLRIEPDLIATLGLRLVDDAEMAKLHEQYMGEPGPTDVLSFAADDELGLGDIAIDWDAVARQAAAPTQQAQLDEATVLLVHGLAHLLGHDHRDRSEGRAMHRLERRVLAYLRVPDPPRPYAPQLLGGQA
jgi:probable rRNA maturation factor